MKKKIKLLRDIVYLISGIAYYSVTGKNTQRGYQALIRLYCNTRGRSSKLLVSMLSKMHPMHMNPPVDGVLGRLAPSDLKNIAHQIQMDGYHVFEKKLTSEMIDEFLRFTQTTEAVLRKNDRDPIDAQTRRGIYDPASPQAVRYDYSSNELLTLPVVQKLISDPTILAVTSAYLGVEPIIDIVTMWWHTAHQKTPDSNAAQLYHFDMERVKWLKFFFYLTDVTTESGPHCFVKGTHNAEFVPPELLTRGYVRIQDDEMQKFFPDRIIEFNGPKGTIIAEDTAGFHKGKHVENGDRLVFQLEFCVTLFGSPNLEKFRITDVRIPALAKAAEQYPRIYSNFEL